MTLATSETNGPAARGGSEFEKSYIPLAPGTGASEVGIKARREILATSEL